MSKQKNNSQSELTKGIAYFVHAQAHEKLVSSIESTDKLKDKSYILMAALLAFCSALAVFVLENLSITKLPILSAAITLICFYLKTSADLIQNLKAIEMPARGNTRKNLGEALSDVKSDAKEIGLILAEAGSLDFRIEQAEAGNNKVATILNKSLESLIYPFVWAAVIIVAVLALTKFSLMSVVASLAHYLEPISACLY